MDIEEPIRSYPTCKPSGVEWLGDLPVHWETRRLKEATTIIAGQSPLSENVSEYLNAFPFLQGNAEFGRLNPNARLACKTPSKRAKAGDILLSVRAPVGALNVADQDYGIGRGLCAVRTRYGLDVLFTYYTLGFANQELLRLSTGSTYDAVTVGIVEGLNIPFPPLHEQHAIVRFLDHTDRRIRRYIRAKERLIELLKEQKQAIIHQAVTGQINVRTGQPYQAYKDSGVEWLGKVPEHWAVVPLKAFAQVFGRIGFRGYSTSDLVDPGTGAITLSPSNLRHGEMDYSKRTYLSWHKYHESPEIKVRDGDILFVKTGASYGKVAVVSRLPEKATINPQLVMMTNIRGNITFIRWALEAFSTQAQIETAVIGGTIPTLSQSKIGRLRFALPVLDEQRAIVTRVNGAIALIATAISKTAMQIEFLQEYRTRLIADVVTGKLDVREVAARLKSPTNIHLNRNGEIPHDNLDTKPADPEKGGSHNSGKN